MKIANQRQGRWPGWIPCGPCTDFTTSVDEKGKCGESESVDGQGHVGGSDSSIELISRSFYMIC